MSETHCTEPAQRQSANSGCLSRVVVRPVKPPRKMKSICMFAGATGFESRGTTEHWAYKHGESDFANNRPYGGDSRRGQSKIDYDHGWLDGKELRDRINEHNTSREAAARNEVTNG